MLGRHAEVLIRRKKRKAKSVNDIRTGNARDAAQHKKSDGADLEARIKSRKAKNLKMAKVKSALAGTNYIARPDISGAIGLAKGLPNEADIKESLSDVDKKDRKAAIDRALRLKGSARIINEAMAHPAWRYAAMAIIRGHLEEGASDPSHPLQAQQNSGHGPRKGPGDVFRG